MTGIRFGLCALVTAALLCSGIVVDAEEGKAPKRPPICNAIKRQATCEARTDCTWVAEAMDKNRKITRRAHCRAKPKK